ncbi:MAG: O-methyltransferase [Tissierellia bacterium]|nr:O-methyltransferase [Tissierellia bacterium]
MSVINQDYIEKYLFENLKPKDELLERLEREAHENHVPIVTPEVAQFLRFFVALKKPKNLLEIGTAIGYSGITMLKASSQTEKLTTIEIRENTATKAMENFKMAGLEDKVEIIVGDGREVLESLEGSFDFVFIDAAKGHYHEYFEEAMRLLAPHGVIICDNVLYKGMVAKKELVERRKKTIVKRLREFTKYVMNLENYESTLIPMGDGLLVSVRLN